ncbi:WD40 repeat-like protein [Metschnikowia bicuspidata var. bicuspidata NRRL YB-4993]|uniref:WD40 repeat-like protein n=1 Tax=Metschnikowia bicuspidata var. bicuspidata NRRL YB-4993 TaxID=869754 RepID=A0A1A0H9X1_9ASCO|nr:WD40 repeat-like protein [Metschnikowia bicuspidata var. bicuspidata NRRL YB-4993]OBA20929.1 WD40 repeat-like protein [Metschnikowia bicuspidata var. bicuspidata NRRL YB-4993]
MDYYEPPSLFRQKALRRAAPGSSPDLGHQHKAARQHKAAPGPRPAAAWLWQHHHHDTLVLDKACALGRTNIKSNYWKIPDTHMNLTALALSDARAAVPHVAISSASEKNNLYIHELDAHRHHLTHLSTITLPHIHGLAWVPGGGARLLVTGNSKGYAHLVAVPRALPDGAADGLESAEIVKRFNHRKHLRLAGSDAAAAAPGRTCVAEMAFLSPARLASCYADTVFVWDINGTQLARRPRPESISVVPGVRSVDACADAAATVALAGAFGVSLLDTRTGQHRVPPPSLFHGRPRLAAANRVKWHPRDQHVLASSHADGVVRVWDVRKQAWFAELTGHRGKTVTAMSWNGDDLFTGASDGNIVHWDLTLGLGAAPGLSRHGGRLRHCSLRDGIDSVAFDPARNAMVERVNERQCGTALPALNNQIVGLCPVLAPGPRDECSILLIDGAAFLGLHCKIYDAARPAGRLSCGPRGVVLDSRDEPVLVSRDEPVLVSRKEPVLVSRKEPVLVSRDEPVLVPRKEPVLVSRKEPVLVPRKEPVLVSRDEPVLVPRKEPVSASRKEPVSASRKEPVSASRKEPVLDFLGMWDEAISLHSVDSSPEQELSPYSSGMLDNSSSCSLSTVATLIDAGGQAMPKDTLFQLLDKELERICDEFPSIYRDCY